MRLRLGGQGWRRTAIDKAQPKRNCVRCLPVRWQSIYGASICSIGVTQGPKPRISILFRPIQGSPLAALHLTSGSTSTPRGEHESASARSFKGSF
jgi:hypothetical protein